MENNNAFVTNYLESDEYLDNELDMLDVLQSADLGKESEDFVKAHGALMSMEEYIDYLESAKESAKVSKKKQAELIFEAAMLQNNLSLVMPITTEDKKHIEDIYAQPLLDRLSASKKRVDRHATVILKKFIPSDLLRAFEKYPESVKNTQGFLYKFEWLYRDIEPQMLYITIEPDIPTYLAPHTEIEVLDKASYTRGNAFRASLHEYAILNRRFEYDNIRIKAFLHNPRLLYKHLLLKRPLLFEKLYNLKNVEKLIQ